MYLPKKIQSDHTIKCVNGMKDSHIISLNRLMIILSWKTIKNYTVLYCTVSILGREEGYTDSISF